MRPTVFGKGWLHDGEIFYGIELGYDMQVEHQGGIGEMRREFGIAPGEVGLESRAVRRIPRVEEFERDGAYGFGYSSTMPDGWLEVVFDDGVGKLGWGGRSPDDDFVAYWGPDGLFVISANPRLRLLHDALVGLDLAVLAKHGTSGQMSVWCTPVLLVKSAVPAGLRDDLLRSDVLAMENFSTDGKS